MEHHLKIESKHAVNTEIYFVVKTQSILSLERTVYTLMRDDFHKGEAGLLTIIVTAIRRLIDTEGGPYTQGLF